MEPYIPFWVRIKGKGQNVIYQTTDVLKHWQTAQVAGDEHAAKKCTVGGRTNRIPAATLRRIIQLQQLLLLWREVLGGVTL